MKKLTSLFGLAILLLGLWACGDEHSKAFHDLEKEINEVEQKILETNDCDELSLLSFSILGIMSDVMNLQTDETVKEGEVDELNGMVERIEATWNKKTSSLNCQEPSDEDSEIDTSNEDDDFVDNNII